MDTRRPRTSEAGGGEGRPNLGTTYGLARGIQAPRMNSKELFSGIVERVGLTNTLNAGLVTRALAQVGATPQMATCEHYNRALGVIRDKLETYLDRNEASIRFAAICVFLAQNE